ncbi:hypothetical protein [Streptomyces sp. NPDC001165]|uniref:hypothetical protein n=1 Tax=Streptomyces sp. NPDC001165 TaxID=3364546 RepID=UPI00367E4A59
MLPTVGPAAAAPVAWTIGAGADQPLVVPASVTELSGTATGAAGHNGSDGGAGEGSFQAGAGGSASGVDGGPGLNACHNPSTGPGCNWPTPQPRPRPPPPAPHPRSTAAGYGARSVRRQQTLPVTDLGPLARIPLGL